MTSVEPPASGDEQTVGQESEDDSVVAPPAYPAYSTPPPEGLHAGEDG